MYSAACRTSLTDRQREKRETEARSEREVDGVHGEVEIRDGIKQCETERVNDGEKKQRPREQQRQND